MVEDLRRTRDDHGTRLQASAGHLLGVTHKLIEVNFWRGHEGSDAAAALHYTLAFEGRQGMASGHQADAMSARQLPFRSYGVTWKQFSCFDALANNAQNPLVRGDPSLRALEPHKLPRHRNDVL